MPGRYTRTHTLVALAVFMLGATGCGAHSRRPVSQDDLVAAAGCGEVETVAMGNPAPLGRSPAVWALTGCGRSILVARTSSGRLFTLDEDVSFDSASEFSQRARQACPVYNWEIRWLGIAGRREATSRDTRSPEAWGSAWEAPGNHGKTRESLQQLLINPRGADWLVEVVIPPEQFQVKWIVDERPPIICGRIVNDSGTPVLYSCYEVRRPRSVLRSLYLCGAIPVP